MRSFKRIAAVLAMLVLVPALAFAQASITGTVRDASGAVLPGVTVEASSPALIEKVRATVTDGEGLYRIVDLRPGTYSVTATLPGFSTAKRDGIVLTGTVTLTVPLEMKVGALEETITVTGETPVVDVQNTRRENVLSSDVISSLPVTRAYGSLLNVTPGLTVDNNGLAVAPTMTFFTANGGNNNEGRMQINGMTVAAAFNGGGVSSLTLRHDQRRRGVGAGVGRSRRIGDRRADDEHRAALGRQPFHRAGVLQRRRQMVERRQHRQRRRAEGDCRQPAGSTCGRGTPAFRSAVPSSAIGSGSTAPIASSRSRRRSRAWSSTRTPATSNSWAYLADPTIQGRNVQGRDIWDARVTAQLNDEEQASSSRTSISSAARARRSPPRAARDAASAGAIGSASATCSRLPKRTRTTSSCRTT